MTRRMGTQQPLPPARQRRWRWRPRPLLLRLAPYGGAALILLGLARGGISESLDLLLYDAVTSLRPAPSGQALPIAIVGIDEGDIDHYGWPIDDAILCRAIDQALAAGASAVGVDLYRDKGIGPNQACLRERSRAEPRLVTIFNAAEGIEALPGSPPQQRAFNDLVVDADGVVRRDLVHVSGQDAATVSLPLRVVEVATGDRRLRRQLENPAEAEALGPWLQERAGGYRQLDAGGYQRMLPILQRGSMRSLSLRALADGPRVNLRGRIVLIGSTAPSLKDLFETPTSRFTRQSNNLRQPGVELHALRVAALLNDRSGRPWGVRTASAGVDNALELLMLLLGAGLGEAFVHLRRSVIAVVLAMGLLASVGWASLWWWGLWLGLALPLIGLPLMAAVGWLRRGALSQLQRQQVQRLLGQTTSPAVAEQLWEQRDELLRNGRFKGRQLAVTILFSDTCNFTSVSEQFSPAALLDWLNRGMAQLVPAVTRHGGMVNKFTGDGLLAVFGAPISQSRERDAHDAIAAALEIQQSLEQLNRDLAAEGAPAMRMRIGVHSGLVLAGSMGSSERLEYAVLGDAVNCASRLESLNKDRQNSICRVLVSGSTRALLSDNNLIWEPWGEVQVKGRQEPLQVWELRGDTADAEISPDSGPADGPANRPRSHR